MRRSLASEQTGSVVVFIVFTIAIFGGGFIYTQLDRAVDSVDEIVQENDILNVQLDPMSEDVTYNFYMWMWDTGIPVMLLIGVIIWFIAVMQKARYREM